MTRYHAYMRHINNKTVANDIEQAVIFFTEDIVNYLIDKGVKSNSILISEIRSLHKISSNEIQGRDTFA